MIRVLVVEDTPVICEFLVYLLNSAPGIQVVGTARDGEEALDAVARKKPDVITMDVHMPRLNGLDATTRIMETNPTPIVIVSGSMNSKEASWVFRALDAGALAAVQRPPGIGHPSYESAAAELIQTVRLMSEVKVVRRWKRHGHGVRPVSASQPRPPEAPGVPGRPRVIAVGASTGGPAVLQRILSELDTEMPVPVLVVQHISPGFGEGLAEWLAKSSSLPVQLAVQGQIAQPGTVYLAPDGFHLGIRSDGKVLLSEDPPEHGHRPSVSYLFRSVADAFGSRSVGVLLTGMGKDGAAEMAFMKHRGSVTLAQDRGSCIVYGMPGEAVQLGGATYVLPPEKMAAVLNTLAGPHRGVITS